jgi:hypothetical protein
VSATAFGDLSSGTRLNATKSPKTPMKVDRPLSAPGIGHSQANARIAMLDMPNNTISNIPSDLSFIIFSLPLKFLSQVKRKRSHLVSGILRKIKKRGLKPLLDTPIIFD